MPWELNLEDETTVSSSIICSITNGNTNYVSPKCVLSDVKNETHVIGVEQSVTVVDGSKGFSVNLRNNVACLSQSGDFVACGDALGNVHLFKVETDSLVFKFSKRLCTSGQLADIWMKIEKDDDGVEQLQVVCASPENLFYIHGITVDGGALNLKGAAIAKASEKDIHTFTMTNEGILVTAGRSVSTWALEDRLIRVSSVDPEDSGSGVIRRIQSFGSGFLTLCQEGKLSLWDTTLLLVLYQWQIDQALDFRVLGNTDQQKVGETKLVVVKKGVLQTLLLDGLKVCFEHKVSGSMHLTSCSSDMDIFATQLLVDDEDAYAQVKLCCFTETDPAQRAYRYISRKRFSEAEDIIRSWGLDIDLTPYYVQERLFDDKGTFKELVQHLSQQKQKLLQCKETDLSKELLAKIVELDQKLKLFKEIYGISKYSVRNWQQFTCGKTINIVSQLIRDDSATAFFNWDHFKADLQKEWKATTMDTLLHCITSSTPRSQVFQWISFQILPTLDDFLDESLASIAGWIQKILNMDKDVDFASEFLDEIYKLRIIKPYIPFENIFGSLINKIESLKEAARRTERDEAKALSVDERRKDAMMQRLSTKYKISLSSAVSRSEVVDIAKYFIGQRKEMCLEEALDFLKEWKVSADLQMYQHYCRVLVQAGEFDEFEEFIHGLEEDEAVSCCRFILLQSFCVMGTNPSGALIVKDLKKKRLYFFKAGIICCSLLLRNTTDTFVFEEIKQQKYILEKALHLEEFFGLNAKQEDLTSKEKCEEILQASLMDFCDEKVISLGNVLEVSPVSVLSRIALKAAESEDFQALVFYAGEIKQTVVDYEDVPRSCQPLQQLQDRLVELPDVAVDLATALSSFCHIDELPIYHANLKVAMAMKELNEKEEPLTVKVSQSDMVDRTDEKLATGKYVAAFNFFLPILAKLSPTYIKDNYGLAAEKLREIVYNLLKQEMTSEEPDEQTCVAAALLLPPSDNDLELSSHSNCRYLKLKSVAEIVNFYATVRDNNDLLSLSRQMRRSAEWGDRLANIGVHVDLKDFSNTITQLAILQQLVDTKHCHLEIHHEFCRDFHVHEVARDKSLIQLCSSLLRRHQFFEARAALEQVSSLTDLVSALKEMINTASPYDYESLELLLKHWINIEADQEATTGLNLLGYLKHYNRCADPSPEEESYLTDSPEWQPSSSRLPYHLCMGDKRWRVMQAELTVDNIEIWLKMSEILKVQAFRVCRHVVNELITNYCKSHPSTDDTQAGLSREFTDMLAALSKVLPLDENPQEILLLCFSKIDAVPRWKEKVAALKVCYQYAQQWAAEAPEDLEREKMRKFFEKKLVKRETYLAVSRLGPLSKESKRLLEQPDKLIQHLYSLPQFVSWHKENRVISEVCEEIARMYNLDFDNINNSMLSLWLEPETFSNSKTEADQIMRVVSLVNANPDLLTTLSTQVKLDSKRLNRKVVAVLLQTATSEWCLQNISLDHQQLKNEAKKLFDK